MLRTRPWTIDRNNMSHAMSFECPRTSVFTFQSSVHSGNVLHCLEQQRQRDVLCDVTVVVEGQSFRGHRAVLAACSDYFQARMSRHNGPGLVLTLPPEVTVEGFEPLLQFAYTAKLSFTKDNILEIRNCAATMGFHNLDKVCFDFLIPKFFDSTKSTQPLPRKSCCKTRCWKQKASWADSGVEQGSTVTAEDEEDKEIRDPEDRVGAEEVTARRSDSDGPALADPPVNGGPASPGRSKRTGYASQCPKYRKFQVACGKGSPCLLRCDPPGPTREAAGGDSDGTVIKSDADQTVAVAMQIAHSTHSPCTTALSENASGASFGTPHSGCDQAQAQAPAPDGRPLAPSEKGALAAPEKEEDLDADWANRETTSLAHWDGERSRVEQEVAEHLVQGFWPESGRLEPSVSGRSSDCCWLKQLGLDSSKEGCPFLRELGAEEVQDPRCEGAFVPDKSPYVSSVNSGDDSDLDTEGDSESCTRERARKVQLPFSVEQIAGLSRNDFQRLLRLQPLTREQLDLVHDVRRRSKNRVAAQRCRKRKLDCIQNLECEIEKLRSEKDKLTQEQNRLSHLKLKTRQDLWGLCQRVCREAALRPEQLQVLAKYTSPDCPLSVLIAPLPSNPARDVPDAHPCLDVLDSPPGDPATEGLHDRPFPDTCQGANDKRTTDQ